MSDRPPATIGRPRLFDEEAVLSRLTALFWRQGYSQTTVAQIVQASGVHKPSLYRTFGGKDELFAKVLRRYLAERMQMFADMIEQAGPGIEGIHTFLDLFEADAVSERGRDGCLMVMASNELRGRLPGYDFSTDYRQQMGQQIENLVTRGLSGAEPDVIRSRADLLTTSLLGLQVIMRSGASAEEIRRYLQAVHLAAESWRA